MHIWLFCCKVFQVRYCLFEIDKNASYIQFPCIWLCSNLFCHTLSSTLTMLNVDAWKYHILPAGSLYIYNYICVCVFIYYFHSWDLILLPTSISLTLGERHYFAICCNFYMSLKSSIVAQFVVEIM